jgi:hypothetical protein
MGFHLGMNALIRARDDGVALFQPGVDPPVTSSPVAVFAEESYPARDENLHEPPE